MTNECTAFRTLLEHELSRPGNPTELTPLSWHEHLLSCHDCRELLAAEEALELLLTSLPEPRLPEDLTRRVLTRLRTARLTSRPAANGLDALLEADTDPRIPVGLSSRVLSALETERSQTSDPLDRLLDRFEVAPDPELAHRVLRSLESERVAPILPFHERPFVKVLLASAAAALVFFTARGLSTDEKSLRPSTEVAFADPDLLEDYYVLDNWTLLMPESDVEVFLATAVDPADEIALSLDEEQE